MSDVPHPGLAVPEPPDAGDGSGFPGWAGGVSGSRQWRRHRGHAMQPVSAAPALTNEGLAEKNDCGPSFQ